MNIQRSAGDCSSQGVELLDRGLGPCRLARGHRKGQGLDEDDRGGMGRKHRLAAASAQQAHGNPPLRGHGHGICDEDHIGPYLFRSFQEYPDVPVHPAVGENDDGVAPLQAQQVVGAVKPRRVRAPESFPSRRKRKAA